MNTKYFNVKSKKKIKGPKSTYRIHANFMFGDASSFSKKHWDFDSSDEFDLNYRVYLALFKKCPSEIDCEKLLNPCRVSGISSP